MEINLEVDDLKLTRPISLNSEVVNNVEIDKPMISAHSSDDEAPVVFKRNLVNLQTRHRSDEISDDEIVHRKNSSKKLFDESDDESIVEGGTNREPFSEIRQTDENGSADVSSDTDKHRQRNILSSDSSSSSSGDENEEKISLEAIKSKIRKKHVAQKSTSLIAAPSRDNPEKPKAKPTKEKALSRKAKEAALAEIHSETQRMIRERKVTLPYHKPKQRSLADFLDRRKLAPIVPLKTTSDELAKVWKHAEERERMAEIFYRSESDEETANEDGIKTKSVSLLEVLTDVTDEVPETGDSQRACKSGRLNNADQLTPSATVPVAESEDFPRLQLSDILNDSDCVERDYSSTNQQTTDANTDSSLFTIAETREINTPDNLEDNATDGFDKLRQNSVTSSSQSTDDNNSFAGLSEKINNYNLPIAKCPKISGAPNELIDLDELATKPGAFGLMRRFLKHAKLRPKIKAESGVLSVMTSEVNDDGEVVNINKETINVSKDEPKPGETLVVLKHTLQQQIAVNRELQLAKKIEEYKIYEDEFYGIEPTSDVDEDVFSDDECGLKNRKCDNENEEKIYNPFVDKEADESGDDGDDAVNDDDNGYKSDVEETASVLLGDNDGADSPEEDDDSDSNLCEDEDEDDKPDLPTITAIPSLAGTQNGTKLNESQLMALCSGTFSSSTLNIKSLEHFSENFQSQDEGVKEATQRKNIIESDDDELISPTKPRIKRNRRLSFSDDEDDDGFCAGKKSTSEDEEIGENNEPTREVDEDDEEGSDVEGEEVRNEEELIDDLEEDENDEEVQLAKKLSKGFLDKEAELSESEWGSEDEDEKGLDRYEEEEGDKDEISQRRLQKELGKIHMREVLADDNREIRILQELLLEDGELHSEGPKRQRQFRWYNQDEDNLGENKSSHFVENGNENADEEDEEAWRRQRLDRENYLRKKKIDNLDQEIADSPVNFNDTRRGVKSVPKVASPANNSMDPKSNFSIFVKRGSFLGRGEKMLSKLAGITTNAGTKESSLGNVRNNRNMVFSVVSPPKEKLPTDSIPDPVVKRKGDFLATSVVKKLKMSSSSTTKVSVLDQLKLLEST